MTSNKRTPPTAEAGDHGHMVVRAALGSIPVAGAALVEFFTAVIAPPLEKRRQKWMEDVASDLNELMGKVEELDADALRGNDAFVSTLMHATQIAMRNHHEEKREALRNAVLNVAADAAPAEDRQLMFLNFIDVMTTTHLLLLKLLQNPDEYAKDRGKDFSDIMAGGFSTIIERIFPELKGKEDFYDIIGKELYARGLINTESFHGSMTGRGLRGKRTTEMGDQFLSFIEKPAI